ncbi:unnamed protein product [Vicia faba]|uniref:LYK3/RLK10-like LysM domain-containing protein n=1 Tax=Vicia faba TaxID=3906 RepID=A0AAV0YMC0_VICFA|nr:unnamed protein product [Vicia faba]
MKLKNGLLLFFMFVDCIFLKVESKCVKGCDVALAFLYVMPLVELSNITTFMQSKIVTDSPEAIIRYNRDIVLSNDNLFSYSRINIPFPCECMGGQISKDYGLFVTYPLRPRDSLEKIASHSKLDEGVIQSYNLGVNFSKGSGIVFFPGRDNGEYLPLYPRSW